MIFDDSLRQFLTDKVEFFAQNPDRLIISVEKGSLKWTGQSLSHRQHYQLLVEVDEFPESIDANLVIVAILAWYQENQDPVPSSGPSPIEFESYILSNYTTTVVFTIKVEEIVQVSTDDSGHYVFNACPRPILHPPKPLHHPNL
ncbi:phage tail protein [Psychrobacter sp. T6-1]|uniref:phage tail protein n=1 Tax=Psychrobacter sp. T6-1 TaxID=3457447 RepID=UPI003FCF66D7